MVLSSRAWRPVAALVGVAVVSWALVGCGGSAGSTVRAGAPAASSSSSSLVSRVVVPGSVEEARPLVVRALSGRGESAAFANCVVDGIGERLGEGERRYGWAMLALPADVSGDELAGAVQASGLVPGQVDPELAQRVFAVQDSCRGADAVSTTAPAAAPPSVCGLLCVPAGQR